jgi:hypothetical protein
MIVKTGIVAALAAVTLLLGATVPDCVQAQGGGCVEGCRAAYGDCYRSTSNRAACEAQLQRCMQGCIASKRG